MGNITYLQIFKIEIFKIDINIPYLFLKLYSIFWFKPAISLKLFKIITVVFNSLALIFVDLIVVITENITVISFFQWLYLYL